jgi:hypothetical protein
VNLGDIHANLTTAAKAETRLVFLWGSWEEKLAPSLRLSDIFGKYRFFFLGSSEVFASELEGLGLFIKWFCK